MSVEQQMGEGRTAIQEMEAKYVKNQQTVREAERLRMILLGEPGDGKSYFIQSHPSVAVLNFDGSPVVNTGFAGSFLVPPHWESARDHVEEWLRDPKIKTIAIDSYGPMLTMLREYAAWRLAKRAADQRGQGFNVKLGEMDPWAIEFTYGENVWKLAYGWFSDMLSKIDRAGKGWIVSLHIDRDIYEAEDASGILRKRERMMPVATVKQMRRMYGPCDVSVVLRHQVNYENVGRGAAAKQKRQDRVMMYTQAPSDAPELGNFCKARPPQPNPKTLPQVLDVSKGWSAWADQWNSLF